MTRTANARVAGFTYLFYIAAAYPGMVLADRATSGAGTATKLARIAQHTTDLRVAVVLSFLSSMSALVLAVTLYAITRDEDHDVALLALSGRVGEGMLGAIPILANVGLLWLVTSNPGTVTQDVAQVSMLAEFLMSLRSWGTTISAFFFAFGSTLFSWLLLRGRIVPAPLAALGLLSSLVVLTALPAQLAGFLHGSVTDLMWIPVAIFEIVVALWLIIKGAAMPRAR